MNLPLLIILFSCCFNLLSASQVMFYKASEDRTITLQNHLICFYSQELLKAGLFTDEASALQAAKEEVLTEATGILLHFFCLTADECRDTHFGYIAYSVDAKTAYIESIYIDEKYHGKGLGKRTLYSLENELREKGINMIKLYVFAHNQAAFSLYKNKGYVIEQSYFSNEIPIGYHMKKEITKKQEMQL